MNQLPMSIEDLKRRTAERLAMQPPSSTSGVRQPPDNQPNHQQPKPSHENTFPIVHHQPNQQPSPIQQYTPQQRSFQQSSGQPKPTHEMTSGVYHHQQQPSPVQQYTPQQHHSFQQPNNSTNNQFNQLRPSHEMTPTSRPVSSVYQQHQHSQHAPSPQQYGSQQHPYQYQSGAQPTSSSHHYSTPHSHLQPHRPPNSHQHSSHNVSPRLRPHPHASPSHPSQPSQQATGTPRPMPTLTPIDNNYKNPHLSQRPIAYQPSLLPNTQYLQDQIVQAPQRVPSAESSAPMHMNQPFINSHRSKSGSGRSFSGSSDVSERQYVGNVNYGHIGSANYGQSNENGVLRSVPPSPSTSVVSRGSSMSGSSGSGPPTPTTPSHHHMNTQTPTSTSFTNVPAPVGMSIQELKELTKQRQLLEKTNGASAATGSSTSGFRKQSGALPNINDRDQHQLQLSQQNVQQSSSVGAPYSSYNPQQALSAQVPRSSTEGTGISHGSDYSMSFSSQGTNGTHQMSFSSQSVSTQQVSQMSYGSQSQPNKRSSLRSSTTISTATAASMVGDLQQNPSQQLDLSDFEDALNDDVQGSFDQHQGLYHERRNSSDMGGSKSSIEERRFTPSNDSLNTSTFQRQSRPSLLSLPMGSLSWSKELNSAEVPLDQENLEKHTSYDSQENRANLLEATTPPSSSLERGGSNDDQIPSSVAEFVLMSPSTPTPRVTKHYEGFPKDNVKDLSREAAQIEPIKKTTTTRGGDDMDEYDYDADVADDDDNEYKSDANEVPIKEVSSHAPTSQQALPPPSSFKRMLSRNSSFSTASKSASQLEPVSPPIESSSRLRFWTSRPSSFRMMPQRSGGASSSGGAVGAVAMSSNVNKAAGATMPDRVNKSSRDHLNKESCDQSSNSNSASSLENLDNRRSTSTEDSAEDQTSPPSKTVLKRTNSLGNVLKEISTLFREGRITKEERKARIYNARMKSNSVKPVASEDEVSAGSSGGGGGGGGGGGRMMLKFPRSLRFIPSPSGQTSDQDSPSALSMPSGVGSPLSTVRSTEETPTSSLKVRGRGDAMMILGSLRPKSFSHNAVFPSIKK